MFLKSFFQTAILCLLLASTTSCGYFGKKKQEQPMNRAQEIELAKDLEKREDYRKAIVSWQKLLKLDPENGYFLYHLGWNYSRLKEYAKAEKYLKESLEFDKDNVDAMLALAYVYLWTEHFDQAKKLFMEVLERVPDYKSAQQGLSEVKNREEAAALEKVVQEKKEAVSTQQERADHFEREGDLSQALLEWEKLSVEDPKNAYYFYQMGRLYQKMGQQQKAGEYLIKSLQLDPKNADAKVVLANVYRDLHQNDQAKRLYEEVLQEYPTYEDARIGLESIQKGEKAAAEQRAKEKQRDFMDQAEQLEKQERFQEALLIWIQLLDQEPNNAYFLYKAGLLYSRLDDNVKAEKFLKKSLNINPDNADAQVAIGYVYLRLNDLQKAKVAFKAALKLVPDYKAAKEGLENVDRQISAAAKKKKS